MTTIPRLLARNIESDLFKGKVIVVVGARQVGKTTLLQSLPQLDNASTLFVNADNPSEQAAFGDQDLARLIPLVDKYRVIVIDESQRIENIGITGKLLVDHYQKDKQIILTGSSTLHLLDQTSESLTGRKFVHHLYPISYQELVGHAGLLDILKKEDSYLRFGLYPEILSLTSNEDKMRRLQEIFDSYLFRDILEFQSVRNPQVLRSLLKVLALQIGSEISYANLSNSLDLDQKTIERYIDLLEKSFVIFRLPAFSQHRIREVTKNKKIYFYDLGIRNAAINNFNLLDSRDDVGRLWENFLIVERLKYRSYQQMVVNQYFWRTYDGSEIDLVEEVAGELHGYEIKHQFGKKSTTPLKWKTYPHSSFATINSQNLQDFIY